MLHLSEKDMNELKQIYVNYFYAKLWATQSPDLPPLNYIS